MIQVGASSRRAFLGCVASALAAPVVLPACRRRDAEPVTLEPAAPDDAAAAFHLPLPAQEPIIRVRVQRIDGDRSVRIDHERGNVMCRLVDGSDEVDGATIVLHAPVTVSRRRRTWRLRDRCGWGPPVPENRRIELTATDGASLQVDGVPHPAAIRFVARGEHGFDVVNHVPVDTYLPGVLAGELFQHWDHETYAAQAVAARSFACAENAIFRTTRHYDVTNTASSQVYEGGVDHDTAREAVAATRGLVLSWAEGLVPGYYSSCCGGTAAAAADAIGSHPINTLPPLQGRSGADVCDGAPLHRWSMDRTRRDVARRIAAYGRARRLDAARGIDAIDRIEVSEYNAHGRPRTYCVGGRAVEFPLEAEGLRRAVDYTDARLPHPAKSLWSSHVDVEVRGDAVRFRGRGHGHGVGLCQYGARALARQGSSYEEILAWYYPGATFERAWRRGSVA